MTEPLADIANRIHGVHQLDAVVAAMRGIAATRAQQSRGLLVGIQSYANLIAQAIAQALRLLPQDGSPPMAAQRTDALILFAAEGGFAGAFGDRMLAAAGDLPATTKLFLIGTRGARQAEERGLRPIWQTAMAAHVGSVPAVAARIADALFRLLPDAGISQVAMVVPVWTPGSGLVVERRSLLPLDHRHFAALPQGDAPLISLPPALLLERLAEEYVYAQLCQAAMHAFAAENEARAAAMVRAKGNVESMLAELQAKERRLRQEAITAEVIELRGGAGTPPPGPLPQGEGEDLMQRCAARPIQPRAPR
jgi:F-type H+-transporting ATPase subunit gamma